MENRRNSAAYREPLAPEPPRESSISRLIITPLTFVSFLLSLALIDSHNSSLRSSLRPSPISNTPPSLFCKTRNFLHGIVFREVDGRGPYAYVKAPVVGGCKDGRERKEREWYYHSKQRHIMKAEFEDAFQMRNSVAVGILAVVLGAFYAVVMVGRWVLGWVMG
ncbi:hypothetical protein BJ875DRAFT_388228 [Amylocarpus encephaloides]|uniref:Uncharacterized protein n=1 Tax=Amylocarpus encephaloides TaxID=45428 RepID=A0A9P8C0L9_9HELO|nr:hypothetical protein BJ875DRAFT_388228 [Amylocarpus encephaloides]